ncbi:CmlA/FloR family chloramphenicol efflux MFS transporter [Inquilinus sp. Marseille-Q2685]|uniref:CmlA/FloR family chloramphenicol efflux MFS transporter n=1 Tax=Inquilinus sp. Marseille-Q2685 TaxID=2866581 RepID=UPI001CE40976|nr:CmlA/FloR family chloramphenicol efflux MFS transporter [Inquilinus sp. Marseille-Q2685]
MPAPRPWPYSLAATLLLMSPFDLLASLGMDVYLPVVPLMPAALAATPALVQLTLSLYLLLLGCGQLLFGPLSDRVGRRPVLLGGALLFTLASAGLALTSSAVPFLALRLVQAAGAAAMLVATFATVRDVYAARREGAVIYSLLGSMLAFVPAFGPLLGAGVDHGFGWRGIFWLLAGLGALAGLQALRRWPETRPEGGDGVRLCHVGAILGSGPFWTYTLGFSAAMGAFFVYFSTAPAVLIGGLGLTPIGFSLAFGTAALVMIATSRFAGRFTARWGRRGCLIRGMALLLAGAVLLVLGKLAVGPSLWAFLVPVWVISAGISVTCAVTANGALQGFGHVAGTATALYACLEGLIVGAVGTLAVLVLPAGLALAGFCALAALVVTGLALRLPAE